MKEILIPLNFTTTPVLYDSKQSFSTSDEESGVLTFTTTADVTGTVVSLTIRNASENANRQTVRIERLAVNSSPFSYTFRNPLPFGQYEGTVLLKKNLTVIASASFLFGVNSSLSAEVLPKLVEAYSLDNLVEEVETEVSNLKDAYTLTVSETVKGVNKTENSLQAQENVRYLNEHQRKDNELERIANENARIAAEVKRKDTFDTLVDSEVIEQTVVQEVAEKYQEIEALNTQEMVSFRQQLADKAQQSALDVEKQRINSLIELPEGSTSNDARLEDIKIAYDGTVHDSPGDAVRAIGSRITQELSEDHVIRKLPNGVEDEVVDGGIIKRVSSDVKTVSSKLSFYLEYENTATVTFLLSVFPNLVAQTTLLDGSVKVVGKSETTPNLYNNRSEIGKFYTTQTQLVFVVAKGSYTTTTNARNNFPIQTLNYQLATPTQIQFPTKLTPNTKEILRLGTSIKEISEEVFKSDDFQISNEFINGGFLNGTENWVGNLAGLDVSDGVLTAIAASINNNFSFYQEFDMVEGHKYYLSYQIKPFRTHFPKARMDVFQTAEQTAIAGQFTKISMIFDITSPRPMINFYANGFHVEGLSIGSQTQFKEMMLIDLTDTFGEGNEPTKEKFEQVLNYLPSTWFVEKLGLKDWQKALAGYVLNFNKTPEAPDEGDFAKRLTSLEYKEVDGAEWKKATGIAMVVPDTDRVVHTVELSGLDSDMEYEFRVLDKEYPALYLTWNRDPSSSMVVHWHTFKPHPVGNYAHVFSESIHKFKTMPKTLASSIKFAQITDTHGSMSTKRLLQDIAEKGDIRCMIHSGDIATGHVGNGTVSPQSWYQFFSDLKFAVNPDGCIIPMLANIGNHEVLLGSGGVEWDDVNDAGNKPDFDNGIRADAEWYYSFFPSFPGLKGYGVVDFGDYASVWQLDPGITTLTTGAQSEFIVNSLAERVEMPHKIISYHYSPYPSGRRAAVPSYSQVRQNWVPLFQDYKPLVVSGHDHVWSKTVPIYDNVRDDEKGVVFMTSGPTILSTDAREGRNPHTKWYLEDSRAKKWVHFPFEKPEYVGSYGELRDPHELDGTTFTNEEVSNWLQIEIDYEKRIMTSFDGNKNVIHSFTQTVNPYSPN